MSSRNYNVYPTYNTNSPPDHPGKPWTRFVCISDTHSRINFSVPPGDVLVHAGDISSWGSLPQLRTALNWLRSLPHKMKIVVAGNHDLCLDSQWKKYNGEGLLATEIDEAQELMRSNIVRDEGIIYLDRESVEIVAPDGVKWRVYGSPAAPFYAQGAFQYKTTQEAIDEWSHIPPDVDILITHTPPYGVLDKTRRGKLAGCQALATRLNVLTNCRLHIFGHIHEAHGVDIRKRLLAGDGLQQIDFISVNAATSSSAVPIIVDLKKDA